MFQIKIKYWHRVLEITVSFSKTESSMIKNKKQTMLNHLLFTRLFLLMIVFNITFPAQAESIKNDQTVYTIGIIPQFQQKRLHHIWRPLLSHLEKKTGYILKIKGSPSIPEFEKELLKGGFDFAYTNPYLMLLANKEQGYLPLVKDIGKTLHGVIVVNKKSNITSISQLVGKIIAFPSPNALGASLLIQQELQDDFNIKINPIYVKNHDSVYLNVLLNKASAGGGVQKTLNKQKLKYRESLTVLHTTVGVAPHPIAVHPNVPTQVAKEIKQALLKFGESSEGITLLAKIPIKEIGSSKMEDYQILKKLNLDRFYKKPAVIVNHKN